MHCLVLTSTLIIRMKTSSSHQSKFIVVEISILCALFETLSDLWLMITIYFAKYVNANAEKLRHLFVNHDGKIKLTIEQMQREPE